MNKNNIKTNEPHESVLNLSQRLDLRSSKLNNLSIYYTWKNIKKNYKNNKLKIIAPTWNDEFELLDGSYSVSLFCVNISLKISNINNNSFYHIHINRIINKLVLEIKDEYKLE